MPQARVPFQAEYFATLAEVEAGHWWFRARNRLILWVLSRRAGPLSSFLEIGCGTGYVMEAVRSAYPAARIFGTEFFSEGIRYAQKRVPTAEFRCLDATVMDERGCYDVIGAFDVIEHIENDVKVLENISRALTIGGSVVITVPQHRWLWSREDEFACHVRRYSRDDLVAKLQDAGLIVEYVTSFVSLLVPLMWLSRRCLRTKERAPLAELEIPSWLNGVFGAVMYFEFLSLRCGLRLPVGGSLLAVARKRKVDAYSGV